MSVSVKQAQLLTQLKLPVPPDTATATRLLDYVLNGNNSRGIKAKDWRAITRKYWCRWVGQTVQIVQRGHPLTGYCGLVKYLKARTAEEASIIRTKRPAAHPLPFTAVVELKSATNSRLVEIHLTGLKIVCRQTLQPRLFL